MSLSVSFSFFNCHRNRQLTSDLSTNSKLSLPVAHTYIGPCYLPFITSRIIGYCDWWRHITRSCYFWSLGNRCLSQYCLFCTSLTLRWHRPTWCQLSWVALRRRHAALYVHGFNSTRLERCITDLYRLKLNTDKTELLRRTRTKHSLSLLGAEGVVDQAYGLVLILSLPASTCVFSVSRSRRTLVSTST